MSFEEGIRNVIYFEYYDKYIQKSLIKLNTNIDNNVYEIFVFCSGKCGSTTLYDTFKKMDTKLYMNIVIYVGK